MNKQITKKDAFILIFTKDRKEKYKKEECPEGNEFVEKNARSIKGLNQPSVKTDHKTLRLLWDEISAWYVEATENERKEFSPIVKALLEKIRFYLTTDPIVLLNL